MNSLTEILRSYKECQDKNAFKELDNMIYDYLSQAAIEQKDLLIEACKEVLEPCADRKNTGYQRQEEKMTKEFFCFILSLLMRLEKKTEDTNSLLKEILLGDFNADELYYIWNQFKRLSLKKMVQTDRESYNLLERIYRKSYDIYFEKTKSQLEKIPKEQRDPDCIVVLTIQLLGMNHAPTKTLIERVKWLKKLGKKVYIVNTTEQYLAAGEISIYDPAVGSVEESYRNAHVIRFGEDEFDFLQISEKMTIERKLRTVLRLIRQVKPFYILSMGTGSMTADLCGQAIPTASMALAFSNLPHTMNPMKILGRMIREEEKETFQKNADSLTEIFRKVLNNEKLDVKVEKLKDENIASMAVLSEESRRMEEMMKMYGMSGMDSAMFGSKATLVLNANHPLVKFLTENKESENVTVICKQLYDLAMLAHKPLSPEEMTAFVQRSNEIMLLLTK